MDDPLRHGPDGSHGDGPFVQSRGLLGSIFRRADRPQESGRAPEARPAPRQAVNPVDPSTWAPPRPGHPVGSGANRGAESRSLPWWVSPRAIIFAAFIAIWVFQAAAGALFGVFGEPGRSTPTPAPLTSPDPSVPGASTQGRYNVQVERIRGSYATLIGDDGRTYVWKFDKPAVRKVLEQHEGGPVLVFWQKVPATGEIMIVGAIGSKGSVPPGAEEALPTTPAPDGGEDAQPALSQPA